MTSTIAEVFADRASGIGRQVLHGCWLARACRDNDRVLHRAIFLQRFHNLSDGRALLPNSAIDADDVLACLVDDRVNRTCGVSSLTVANNQLALTPADRNHRVDSLDSC